MTMMSIGLFTYSTKPRGSVVHTANLAEALTAMGHNVTVYALTKDGVTFYRDLACPLTLFPAAEAPSNMDDLVAQRIDEFSTGIRSIVARHDIYHAEDCLSGSALLASRQTLGAPMVVRTVHHVERFESDYLAQCQHRSIVEADAVFSVSRCTRREVLAKFGRASDIVPNGVDMVRFRMTDPRAITRARIRFGIESGDVIVLSVGGVEPRKNSLRALEAFAQASARVPRLRWVIVGGEGFYDHREYRARFDAAVATLAPEVAARVVCAGPLPEVELTAAYQLADVLLCPSEREGFGLSILEAAAAGTAIVASRAAPFIEYLDDDSATLVDHQSATAIADALVMLAAHPERRQRLTAAATRVAESMSWSRSAATHIALYRVILDEKARKQRRTAVVEPVPPSVEPEPV
jgi:glycosyltransferase-like protein